MDLPFPKHFLKVAEESIVARTLRLLRERGAPLPTVVAKSHPKWDLLRDGLEISGLRYLPDDHAEIAWSIGQILTELPCGALFILGDVAFSGHAIDVILESRLPLAFFGRPGANNITGKPYDETYALRCDSAGREAVLKAVAHPTSSPKWKLRDLRLFVNVPHVEIDDWTDDIDTDSDLTRILPILDRKARLEAELDIRDRGGV
jgi:hypothetical protein